MISNIFRIFRVTLFSFVLIFFSTNLFSQSTYNSFVDSVISHVSVQSVSTICSQLSGDTTAIIGGLPYTIISRYANAPGNDKAAQYIYEKFQSIGLETRYQTYSFTGKNVIGKKTGVRYPNRQYILCGHYDNIIYPLPVPDTIPGADDNASGIACVIEAARVLSQYDWDCTIIFVALDEEEGYGYGGESYADSAAVNGDSILGVINLDMIAYDFNNDNLMQTTTNVNSIMLAKMMNSSCLVYQPALRPEIHTGIYGSDQISFWEEGFKAIAPHEHLGDFNRFYHTRNDKFVYFNVPYFISMIKSVIACICVYEKDFIINFYHQPITDADTTDQIVNVVIHSNSKIAESPNAPKLYYGVGAGGFISVSAFYNSQDTFKFSIPGQPRGSMVRYYIAAQDSAGTMVGSLPAGARGFNPPGSNPTPVPFRYYVLNILNQCSNGLPKQILPMQLIYDTIKISNSGILFDMNVNLSINHSNDSNLYIWLVRPGATMKQLSTGNGGSGDNYINTTFDDEAFTPIQYGTPPFTGSFKPEDSLGYYDGKDINGDWILRVFNSSNTVTGELLNWCIHIESYFSIGVPGNSMPFRHSLSQNYPNPFNASTTIKFSLIRKSHVKIVVYDVLGKEIRTIVNGLMNYGEHSLSFNANDIGSGLYFYTMFLDGNMFETKKMVLVK